MRFFDYLEIFAPSAFGQEDENKLIHLVNQNAVRNILDELALSGGKGINKRNLERFKTHLLRLVSTQDPSLIAKIRSVTNPRDFNGLIKTWKGIYGAHQPAKRDTTDWENLSIFHHPEPQKQELPDDETNLHNFETTGKLSRRLQWILEYDSGKSNPFSWHLVRYLVKYGVRPERYSHENQEDYINGKFSEEEQDQAFQVRGEIYKNIMLDLAREGETNNKELIRSLDDLEKAKIASLDPPEAIVLIKSMVKTNKIGQNTLLTNMPRMKNADKKNVLLSLGNTIKHVEGLPDNWEKLI